MTQQPFVVVNDAGRYFHFWDRATYGEPQFGDLRGAKVFTALCGCLSRVRSLTRAGYRVAPRKADQQGAAHE